MLKTLHTLEQVSIQEIAAYNTSSHGDKGIEALSFLESLKGELMDQEYTFEEYKRDVFINEPHLKDLYDQEMIDATTF